MPRPKKQKPEVLPPAVGSPASTAKRPNDGLADEDFPGPSPEDAQIVDMTPGPPLVAPVLPPVEYPAGVSQPKNATPRSAAQAYLDQMRKGQKTVPNELRHGLTADDLDPQVSVACERWLRTHLLTRDQEKELRVVTLKMAQTLFNVVPDEIALEKALEHLKMAWRIGMNG